MNKGRAYFVICIGRTVPRGWQASDKEAVSREVGLALLSFYNKQVLEVDRSESSRIRSQAGQVGIVPVPVNACHYIQYYKNQLKERAGYQRQKLMTALTTRYGK